ncbi:MAG TPA: tetratricopeptide repeat protein [Candidatus Brocadiia bacterium]|nr:tetratricopeptide repeat protein [Candidatus Brocadiia bacterium]
MTITPKWSSSLILRAFVAVALLAPVRIVSAEGDPGDIARAGFEAVYRWDVAAAEEACARLQREYPDFMDPLPLKALIAYYRGDYAEAARLCAECEDLCKGLLKQEIAGIRAASEKAPKFEEIRGGHFILRYCKGPDEVMALYAMPVLEAARAGLGAVLNYLPGELVIVEIYPDLDSFILASGLTRNDISTSGTVAICRWGKIMICSPRLYLRGYAWRDTLAHEYVHYCIVRISGNMAPVWLHEGLAKHLESRWRSEASHELSPAMQTLLSDALREGKLVLLEEMHPSLAKLGDRSKTTLAFAEVHAMVRMMEKAAGVGAFRSVLDEVKGGADARAAFEKAAGIEGGTLWDCWVEWMRSEPAETVAGLRPTRPQVAEGTDAEPVEESLESLDAETARNFTILGDMLRCVSPEAAVIEYRKARGACAAPNLGLLIRLSRTLLESGESEEALREASGALRMFPQDVSIQAVAGRAHLAAGRFTEARDALLEAVGVNPFDPTIHRDILQACAQLEDEDGAAREKRALEIILGPRP